jgi:hypothetical protein
MTDMAERIRKHSLELLSKHGFYEYFDPRRSAEGEIGCGTDQFSWSAALCLDFLQGEMSG